MSGITDLKATRETLRELAQTVKSTRQTLAAMIQASHWPGRLSSRRRSGQLADTLQHLGDVREGFVLSQRASPHLSLSELRILVQHILLDWDWLQTMNLALTPAHQIEPVGAQLVAYNHALVALGVLPHLPAEAVTFPQRQRTYADLAAPAEPGELLARIEELEQVIYQAEVMPTRSPPYDSFRRTYAFFEASTWLVDRYLDALLGD
ncbi:MAG: hypothetical protein JXM69_14995 [Anaerolineae bacterium]|nr:hypothetical protein [Anaerolineae bacterium]